ncbi:cyclin N-terminal domain-containing protein 1 [Notolabrus celidotus]|uniref:cyclin N-terminal domain-containing protein 1 n=1 Tax=Notolabrus celidotus TaxID=1203425 RepID=UPI00148FDBA3|nr:cyclin N-terminal domain-containing protein 1 [Notolabrus celidotus]
MDETTLISYLWPIFAKKHLFCPLRRTYYLQYSEYILHIAKDLRLDPLVGYHAIELLQRFMVKHLTDLFTTPTPQGATTDPLKSYEGAVFDKLKEKLPLIIFSCVQLASKMSLHSLIIDNNTAVHFLHSIGLSVSKQKVLDAELMVLKGLDFKLYAPNPLSYVEILLEVLGYNEPSLSVDHLYPLCHHVLQFVSLQRTAIYDALLAIQCGSPSTEQREKFVTVTEDFMLLGIGVISVATFIFVVSKWEQVVAELSHITGISQRSISEFTCVTVKHIVGDRSPATST